MNDAEMRRQPEAIGSIASDTVAMPFNMISEAKFGSLLATLAASKLIDDIERRAEFSTVMLTWASGRMLVVRRAG